MFPFFPVWLLYLLTSRLIKSSLSDDPLLFLGSFLATTSIDLGPGAAVKEFVSEKRGTAGLFTGFSIASNVC